MRRTTPALVAASLATALILAGCGGGSTSSSGDSTPASQKVAGGSTLDSTWPLTGLPVKGHQSAAQKHPVIVTKMDNTYSSEPQLGLSHADMVVEELVEGGLTRLAAFYYSDIPGVVGPVRSMRASDVGIVTPAKADIVTSGAAARTIKIIHDAGITFFGEGTHGFARNNSRPAPYNLFANLSDVVSTIHQKHAVRPPDYLPWGSEKKFPKGPKATSIAAMFSGGTTTNWVYRGGKYVNENTHAAPNDQFPATSVLVLRVQVGDAGYLDPAGNPVPETHFVGKGAAMLFHDGHVVKATWTKRALGAALKLSTGHGKKSKKLTVPAGHVWIELVPANGGNVTFHK